LEPSTAIHAGVGIRSYRDILIHSEKPSPTTECLKDQIDNIYSLHQQQYQFLAGAKRLARLKQRLGHISEVRRLTLSGILEQKISWFLVHSGFTRSAVSHASLSLWQLQTAYYQKSRSEDAREFIKTALIASNANLLAARPAAALQVLDIMRAASERIDAPLGSEFYRQRGVAFFQLGRTYDDDAKKSFEQSEQQMRRLGEGDEAQALMTGTRYVSLLVKPDWEGSLRVVDAAENTFAAESLEMSMTRHWAAACGFLTDDSRIRRWAQETVTENSATARRYGHQATISKLLSITPELGLARGLEAVWLRKTLYQNAFRFK
ncbi:MAG TPA: hypothetical protein VGP68_05415, partial [Gemmataceae bacterium]|nr:hypothetical protein [Gemmataceae bacterium]